MLPNTDYGCGLRLTCYSYVFISCPRFIGIEQARLLVILSEAPESFKEIFLLITNGRKSGRRQQRRNVFFYFLANEHGVSWLDGLSNFRIFFHLFWSELSRTYDLIWCSWGSFHISVLLKMKLMPFLVPNVVANVPETPCIIPRKSVSWTSYKGEFGTRTRAQSEAGYALGSLGSSS